MSDAERARAAIGMLLLAFNPHQRRGPDGRWIKMPTSELKRPRRAKGVQAPQKHEPGELKRPKPPRPPKKVQEPQSPQRSGGVDTPPINLPDPQTDYRERRDAYNVWVLNYADGIQNRPGRARSGSIDFHLRNIQAQATPERRDEAIDSLRSLLDSLHGGVDAIDPPPELLDVPLPTLPPGPRTNGGARPPGTASHAQRLDALDNSVRSGIDGQDILGGGIMGDTRRFQLADGTQAIYKRAKETFHGWDPRDQTDAEALSALVGGAIGAPVPATQRVSDTELYMEVMPGVTGASRHWNEFKEPQLLETDSAVKVGLLDVLINNSDRHSGNWLIDAGEVKAIDHGLAFKNRETERSRATISPFATRHFIGYDGTYRPENPLSPADVYYLHDRLDELEPQFKALGRTGWLNTIRERLDHLALGALAEEQLYPD